MTAKARADTGAQLGVFTLASVLRAHGYDPVVVNLDDLFLKYLRDYVQSPENPAPDKSFCSYVLDHLGTLDFDVFGLSSICSSYPLTVRLAAAIRQNRPDAFIILGGPQASVVDVVTLRDFPCIDIVVRGEADESLPILLRQFRLPDKARTLDELQGITFRRGDEVIRTPNGPVVRDLDSLPLPAFDLDAGMTNREGVHIEIGRGCPFACTFCSTNDFFRRHFRLKSTPKMLEQMKQISAQYGVEYFSFVHDMYTVDRKRVVEFCQALLDSGEKFTWGCSARTDCIDDELIELMARAGCRGIFFGIESGSQRMQHVINKELDLDEAWRRIEAADRHGVDTAVALITGFPEETRDDLRETIHFFIDSLRMDHAEPQLSLLAPLAGTPVCEQHKDELVLDYIFSDMSHQGWRQDPADVELIKAHPEMFTNFYAIPTTDISRTYFREVRDFVTYVSEWFRWLPVSLLHDSGDLLRVFDRWQRFLREKRSASTPLDLGRTPYYCHRQFRYEFLEFVQTCYLPEMASARVAIAALVQIEGFSVADISESLAANDDEPQQLQPAVFPYRIKHHCIVELAIDYEKLIQCLRARGALGELSEEGSTVIFKLDSEARVKVWQVPPLAAKLLRLCDGDRSVEQIIELFRSAEGDVDGIPAEKVGQFGLMLLVEQGFIGLSRQRQSEKNVGAAGADSRVIGQYLQPPESFTNQQPWPPGVHA
jgi:radical SAM superfamily enzyme YgiQ (UPF0313 family)